MILKLQGEGGRDRVEDRRKARRKERAEERVHGRREGTWRRVGVGSKGRRRKKAKNEEEKREYYFNDGINKTVKGIAYLM